MTARRALSGDELDAVERDAKILSSHDDDRDGHEIDYDRYCMKCPTFDAETILILVTQARRTAKLERALQEARKPIGSLWARTPLDTPEEKALFLALTTIDGAWRTDP